MIRFMRGLNTRLRIIIGRPQYRHRVVALAIVVNGSHFYLTDPASDG